MENKKDIEIKTSVKTVDSTTNKTNTRSTVSSESSKSNFKSDNNDSSFGQNRNSYYKPYKQNKYFKRKKFCKLCAKGIEHLDYKDVDTLKKYLNFSLKIASRKLTGACASHQIKISNAIKRARIVALIPFIKE